MTKQQVNKTKTNKKTTQKPKYDLDEGLDYSELDLDGFKNPYQAMYRVVKVREAKMEDKERPQEGYLYHLRNYAGAYDNKVRWWMCWKAVDDAKEWERVRLSTEESIHDMEEDGTAEGIKKGFTTAEAYRQRRVEIGMRKIETVDEDEGWE